MSQFVGILPFSSKLAPTAGVHNYVNGSVQFCSGHRFWEEVFIL